MMRKIYNLLILIFVFSLGYAQKPYKFNYSDVNNYVYYKYVKYAVNKNKASYKLYNINSNQQNCSNAQPVCVSQSSFPTISSGAGSNPNEINPSISCLNSGEINSNWYIINISEDGQLLFDITPVDRTEDYDWAVYDITNHPCSAIRTNASLELSCNYSQYSINGVTGIRNGYNNNSNGANGQAFNKPLNVYENQTLALLINNYSATTNGYTINFSNSTASMYDTVKPKIKSLTIDCNGKLKLIFTENIDCSSFTNTDFIIKSSSGSFSGTIVKGCTSNATYYDEFEITTNIALPISQNYQFSLIGDVVDNCGNISDTASIAFSYNKPLVFLGNDTTICSNNTLLLDATAPNATNYLWNNGASTPTLTVTNSGTYSVAVTAFGCVVRDTIKVIVASPTVPSITISSSKDTACSSENIVFTATPTNGGSNPTFQWFVNNVAVGNNSSTFSSTTLNNNSNVKVVMSNFGSCITNNAVTSNIIKVTIHPVKTPNITLSANHNNVCEGTPIIFSTSVVNSGNNPMYQWYINNQLIGNSTSTFTSNTLKNNDKIRVILTNTSDVCLTKPKDTSEVTVSIIPNLLPSVSITEDKNNVCKGTPITFTATPKDAGNNISYQWYLNNNAVGNNSNVFLYSNFNNNDIVNVKMTVNSNGCFATKTGISNTITVKIDTPVTPIINVSTTSTNICKNELIEFIASTNFGGNNPSIEWFINNQVVANNDSVFSTTNLKHNDEVSAKLTSSLNCVTNNTATSNAIVMTVNEIAYQTPSVEVCKDETTSANLQIQLNLNTNYTLDFRNTIYNNTSIINVFGDSTQLIPFSINYANKCYVEDTLELTVYQNPIIKAISDKLKVRPATLVYLDVKTNETNIIKYKWFPEDSVATPNQANTSTIVNATTNYTLVATDNNNCNGESSVLVEVINVCDEEYIAIPNAFSPNNDGINDCFKLVSPTEDDIVSYNLKIFNRWSELVFESFSIENCWTGFYKNQLSEVDTYTFILQITCTNGTVTKKVGSVALTK